MNEGQLQRFERQERNDFNLINKSLNLASWGFVTGTLVMLAGAFGESFIDMDYTDNRLITAGLYILGATAAAFYPVAVYLMGREIYREDIHNFSEQRKQKGKLESGLEEIR
ncbi:hypothetical protein HY450_03400 [Candidatus Pacearchaeota archaeon]|nr:hypothetical protein [Candidatus Pacearchaeota archaeon]